MKTNSVLFLALSLIWSVAITVNATSPRISRRLFFFGAAATLAVDNQVLNIAVRNPQFSRSAKSPFSHPGLRNISLFISNNSHLFPDSDDPYFNENPDVLQNLITTRNEKIKRLYSDAVSGFQNGHNLSTVFRSPDLLDIARPIRHEIAQIIYKRLAKGAFISVRKAIELINSSEGNPCDGILNQSVDPPLHLVLIEESDVEK